MKRKTYLPLTVLLISALWIVFSRADPAQVETQSNHVPFTGFYAPEFMVTNTLGDKVSLSDYRGRPVLLNFWASWCSPCRAEMPAMERIYREYKEQGFEILAVNSTAQDSLENAANFVKELGLTFPILFDESGHASIRYQLQALPSSYFIDKHGVIQEVVIGGPMSEALLRIRVERLLGVQ